MYIAGAMCKEKEQKREGKRGNSNEKRKGMRKELVERRMGIETGRGYC